MAVAVGAVQEAQPSEAYEYIEPPRGEVPEVDIIASGYEWICPVCEEYNLFMEIPKEDLVKCGSCGEIARSGTAEHAYP